LPYESRDEGPGGADLGSLAHRILARWNFDPADLDRWLPESPTRADILRQPPELRGIFRDDRARQDMRTRLLLHAASPEGLDMRRRLAAERSSGAPSVLREISFRIPLDREGVASARLPDEARPKIPEGMPLLVGAIDLMVLEPERILIRDYKTADPAGAPVELYRHQLAFYAVAAAEGLRRGLGPFRSGATREKDEAGRRVETEILFLRTREDPERSRLHREGPADTKALREDLFAYAREAAGNTYPPLRDRCPSCPFRGSCRFGEISSLQGER
jgi:hypothetical protein